MCAQILYHERRREELERKLGSRFWVVEYEEFCRAPHVIVERVADEILGIKLDRDAVRGAVKPLQSTNKVTVTGEERERIEALLARR